MFLKDFHQSLQAPRERGKVVVIAFLRHPTFKGIFEMSETNPQRRMIYGSRAIAKYLTGDEKLAWKVRRHCGEWPVFLFGDTLVAYADALDEAIAAKQSAGLVSLKTIVRKHPVAPSQMADA